jgi:hypothetical protein
MIIKRSSSWAPGLRLWEPPWAEVKILVFRSWFAIVRFSLGSWCIGFGFDVAPTRFTISIGLLFIGVERDEPPPESYDDLPTWGWTLRRIVIWKWKLELRLDLDLNLWGIGYAMANIHDHELSLGPLNLQIEYDIMFWYPGNVIP